MLCLWQVSKYIFFSEKIWIFLQYTIHKPYLQSYMAASLADASDTERQEKIDEIREKNYEDIEEALGVSLDTYHNAIVTSFNAAVAESNIAKLVSISQHLCFPLNKVLNIYHK